MENAGRPAKLSLAGGDLKRSREKLCRLLSVGSARRSTRVETREVYRRDQAAMAATGVQREPALAHAEGFGTMSLTFKGEQQ